jgi:hypothetical protein
VKLFFTALPLDFDQAFEDRKIGPRAYALGCNLAAKSYRARNTNEGRDPVYISDLARAHRTSPDSIMRWLRALKEGGWIDFPEPKKGQKTPWQVHLTGLDHRTDLRTTSAQEPLSVRKLTSAGPDAAGAASLHGEPDFGAAQPPHLARTKEDETTRDETTRDSASSSLRYEEAARLRRAADGLLKDIDPPTAAAPGRARAGDEQKQETGSEEKAKTLSPGGGCSQHRPYFWPACSKCNPIAAPGGASNSGEAEDEQAVLAEFDALVDVDAGEWVAEEQQP